MRRHVEERGLIFSSVGSAPVENKLLFSAAILEFKQTVWKLGNSVIPSVKLDTAGFCIMMKFAHLHKKSKLGEKAEVIPRGLCGRQEDKHFEHRSLALVCGSRIKRARLCGSQGSVLDSVLFWTATSFVGQPCSASFGRYLTQSLWVECRTITAAFRVLLVQAPECPISTAFFDLLPQES